MWEASCHQVGAANRWLPLEVRVEIERLAAMGHQRSDNEGCCPDVPGGCCGDVPGDGHRYVNLLSGRGVNKCSKPAATWKTAATYAVIALLGCCCFAIAVWMTIIGGMVRDGACCRGSATVRVPDRREDNIVRIEPAGESDSLYVHRRQGSKDEDALAVHGTLHMATALGEQVPPSGILSVWETGLIKANRLVLYHTPQLETLTYIEPTEGNHLYCICLIRDLVFPPLRDSLSSVVVFYYVLDERCYPSENATEDERLMSIRKANLTMSSVGESQVTLDLDVITYLWPLAPRTGPRQASPVLWKGYDISSVPVDAFSPVELSRLGTNLVLASQRTSGSGRSHVTFVSTVYGNRSSVDIEADWTEGFAFNPDKTKLYMSDSEDPPRLFSFSLKEGEIPLGDHAWRDEETIFSGGVNGSTNVSSVKFGSRSLTADGKCLYFVDYVSNRVWAANLASNPFNLTLVAGSGEAGRVDGVASRSSFHGLRSVVATSDGCNLFTTEISPPGAVRWLQLDEPCGKARVVVTIASSFNLGLWGLTLHDDGTKLTRYVGSSAGHLFQLEIDRSLLYICESAVTTPPQDSSSAPLLSAPSPIPSRSDAPPSLSSAPTPTPSSDAAIPRQWSSSAEGEPTTTPSSTSPDSESIPAPGSESRGTRPWGSIASPTDLPPSSSTAPPPPPESSLPSEGGPITPSSSTSPDSDSIPAPGSTQPRGSTASPTDTPPPSSTDLPDGASTPSPSNHPPPPFSSDAPTGSHTPPSDTNTLSSTATGKESSHIAANPGNSLALPVTVAVLATVLGVLAVGRLYRM
ncbi:hypothetical protein CBR_g519 [Chara braunii]|uniref:Uncharacterized protein n=1 Tax=Chara braunii TaxID=69332 RepID=A0A388KBE5_CHABU|nr:hypothetical protein CBR_g519 [Chara braunii]|eukprot:GBG67382.1 hypothetical protein CBR_g519 [Chara braunii]